MAKIEDKNMEKLFRILCKEPMKVIKKTNSYTEIIVSLCFYFCLFLAQVAVEDKAV